MTATYTEQMLIDDRALRAQLTERVEVLDRVKELLLLPNMEMYTMQQIADYYESAFETVASCVKRNREELNGDGLMLAKPDFWKVQNELSKVASGRGWVEYRLDEDVTIRVPNGGVLLFPKRAVLRIGMLLRDSEVAKEVRTQLLNTFETAVEVMPEEVVAPIADEQELLMNVAKAFTSGDAQEIMFATSAYAAFQNRHIQQLEADKRVLTTDILNWTDRSRINKAIRILAGRLHANVGMVWNTLYDELLYKHHIALRMRGSAPYIQHVRDDEWPMVQQTLAAMCESFGISPSRIIDRALLDAEG